MAIPNYITPVGIQRIQWELEWLRTVERPKIVEEVAYAASLGDRSENAEYQYGKRRLRQIDGRVDFLMRSIDRVQIVDPAQVKGPQIRFGATVTIADEEGEERTWKLYGEQEVDVDQGILSHKSPLGLALQGKKAGDAVVFEAPGGRREIEVISVGYDAQTPDPLPDWKVGR